MRSSTLVDVAAQSPAFSGIVMNQTSSQLEPEQGTFDFATLDASLAAVAAYNVHTPMRRSASAPDVHGLRRTRLGKDPRRSADHRAATSPTIPAGPRPVVEARIPVGFGGAATALGAARLQPSPSRGSRLVVFDTHRWSPS